MGASVAWHLARRGVRDVLVVDRAPEPGDGSTGRATGGFRAQYATAVNVRLSLLSREKLRRFREETGVDPGYDPRGYLWLASTEREKEALDEARRIQHGEGLVEAAGVTREEIVHLNPAVSRDADVGVVGGAFCPSDGFLKPLEILRGYVEDATRLGVRFAWGTEVVGLDRDGAGGRITGVRVPAERLAPAVVVNAAGAWAGALGALARVDVPVVPLRRQIVPTVPTEVLPPSMPMTIWATDGFHLRVRDGRVLLLWPTPGVPDAPFDSRVDAAWVDAVAAKARARVPCLANVALDRAGAWAGLYEMSPDKHALLGPAPSCPNLFLVDGSSGHGVMHAPALGQLLAEMVVDGKATSLDASPLRPERFLEGKPNPVSELL